MVLFDFLTIIIIIDTSIDPCKNTGLIEIALKSKHLCRCSCGNCVVMATVQECVCCREQDRVNAKTTEQPDITCITKHPGFQPVCLNTEVLRTAYYAYRQHYRDEAGNEYVKNAKIQNYNKTVLYCHIINEYSHTDILKGHLTPHLSYPYASIIKTKHMK